MHAEGKAKNGDSLRGFSFMASLKGVVMSRGAAYTHLCTYNALHTYTSTRRLTWVT